MGSGGVYREVVGQWKILAEVLACVVAIVELKPRAVLGIQEFGTPTDPDAVAETVHAAPLRGSAEMDDDAVAVGDGGGGGFDGSNDVGCFFGFGAGESDERKYDEGQCGEEITDFHDKKIVEVRSLIAYSFLRIFGLLRFVFQPPFFGRL
ncbi:MAG: hypothetical protein DYG98_01495 [Haliscomenobacteraceae bacterium CHB4]|nr:hypothetical protein [Haliscomenobacteraceae bacterium CHB4]